VRILAQLEALDDPRQWSSNSRFSVKNRARGGQYFYAGLKTGESAIFRRVPGSRDAVPILIELGRTPQYKKRFPYWEVADKTIWDRLPVNWNSAMQYAMGTAR
jgi:hypothetical protein